MPPSFLHLNPNEIARRANNSPTVNADTPDEPLPITSAGPMIGFAVGGLVVLLLVAKLFWGLTAKIRARHPQSRQGRALARRSLSDRILQYLHDKFPLFISSRLPQPTPVANPALSNSHFDPDYPARSIDTLPPYPGFSAPISPADSRRFLYLVPIMPMVEMFSRRPAPGSNTAIASASPTLVDHVVPDVIETPPPGPPPDYITLTPPYVAADDASVVTIPADAHLSRSGQDEWRTRVRNHE